MVDLGNFHSTVVGLTGVWAVSIKAYRLPILVITAPFKRNSIRAPERVLVNPTKITICLPHQSPQSPQRLH